MGNALAARVALMPVAAEAMKESVRSVGNDVGRIHIPEFLLFFALFMAPPLSGAVQIVGNALLLLVVLYTLCFSPKLAIGRYGSLIWLSLLALLYVLFVSIAAEGTLDAYPWHTRLMRIAVILLFSFICATGRIDIRSGALGFLFAALVNIPLFYAGLVSNTYGGYLTGIFGDKNVSGLAYAMLVPIALLYIENRFLRFIICAALLAALWLTGSRTSMGALAGAVIWMYIAPKLPLGGRLVIAAFIYWGIGYLTDEYSQAGVFEERAGSDLLRERIDEASESKVSAAGFWGIGLGEAVVRIEDSVWSFHNSYWSALVEGGWPWLAYVLAMTIVVIFPFWKRELTREQIIAQGLGVIVLVASLRLGEVFLTTYWAIAFSVSLSLLIQPLDRRTVWERYYDAAQERRERSRSQWTGEEFQERSWRTDPAGRAGQVQGMYSTTVALRSRRDS